MIWIYWAGRTYRLQEGSIGVQDPPDRGAVLGLVAGYLDIGQEGRENLQVDVLPEGDLLVRPQDSPRPEESSFSQAVALFQAWQPVRRGC